MTDTVNLLPKMPFPSPPSLPLTIEANYSSTLLTQLWPMRH